MIGHLLKLILLTMAISAVAALCMASAKEGRKAVAVKVSYMVMVAFLIVSSAIGLVVGVLWVVE